MNKLAIVSLLVCSVALAAAAAGTGLLKAKVSDVSWMKGSWQCDIWGGKFEEHWSSSTGGTMVGMGRHVSGGKTGFMEFMSIEPAGEGVTMYILLDAPSKGKKEPFPFKLTSLKGKEAVFENPKNDFPSKITYKMRANGDLWCRIEGKQGGKAAQEDFDFKKLK